LRDVTALVFSEYSAGHDTGSHPESQARVRAIHQRLNRDGLLQDRPVHHAEPADPSVLLSVHDEFLVDQVRELSERGGGAIDGDTLVSPGSWVAALAAVDAGIKAVDLVLSGEHKRVFSIVRPPGHHAERSRQMGFCLFNNVAVAAQHALTHHGLSRVAILDWDVHHGNGTQDIFYGSREVFFCSLHQWPLFPGTGLEHERGVGEGEGYTLNFPLPVGSGDADYLSILDDVVAPAIKDFRPELILVSAGFDSHRDDPLSMMAVSEHGFRRMTERVRRWSEELTEGQLVLLLEGGYNLRALSDSVVAVLGALDAETPNERGQR
jgi:acetoin utilization deacetylase AcuC-like enzyme